MINTLDALGIAHDKRYAECPFCKKRSLRIIANANKVFCGTCIKKPATNIDLVMRVKKVGKEDAVSFLRSLTELKKRDAHTCAQTSQNDLEALCVLYHAHGDIGAHICANHHQGNKFRHDSILVTHACALAVLHHLCHKNLLTGVNPTPPIEYAMQHLRLRFISNRQIEDARKKIRTLFYSADLKKTDLFTKGGSLFCARRNLIMPLTKKNVLVGLIAMDTDLKKEAHSSIWKPIGFGKTDGEYQTVTKPRVLIEQRMKGCAIIYDWEQ